MTIKLWLPVVLALTTSTLYGQYYVNGGWGGGPSTVAQSYAQGYADVVRAAGDYEVNNSVAANNYAAARSQEIDNRLKATQTYFQMRDINKKWTEANKTPPLTQEAAYRWAKQMAPARLTSGQLDPVTGQILWPIALRDPIFGTPCKQIQDAFVARINQGALDYGQFEQVQKAHDEIVALLTKNANRYKDMDLIAAKNMIDSLVYEARLPAG